MSEHKAESGAGYRLTPEERHALLSWVPLAAGRDDDAIVAYVEILVTRHRAEAAKEHQAVLVALVDRFIGYQRQVRAIVKPRAMDRREANVWDVAIWDVKALLPESVRRDETARGALRTTVTPPAATEGVPDLLAALQASLDRAKAERQTRPTPPGQEG